MKLLDVLFPRKCPICRDILSDKNDLICETCKKKLVYLEEPTCFQCGKQLESQEEELCYDCRKRGKSFRRGVGIFFYSDEIRDSLSAIKYENQRDFVDFYEREMWCKKAVLDSFHVDMVVPVPLHPRKQRQRGFNQAMLFATRVAAMIQKPVSDQILKRNLYTTPQKSLGPGERLKNLQKAFSVDFKAYQEANCPQRILLVDDIYTTGATVESIARCLKQAGVKEVFVFCIAIGRDL